MKEFLEPIVQEVTLEARWLQTLSLLESIGAQKIEKTVLQKDSLEIIEHHADETRHAAAFKMLSHQLSGGKEVTPLCEIDAIHYFQTLDHQLSEWISRLTDEQDAFQNYLLVTSIIERRAMKLYPLYKKLTRQELVQQELGRVIEEENSHRRLIEKQCLEILNRYGVTNFDECEAMEEKLFQEFVKSLSSHCKNNHLTSHRVIS